MLVRLIIKLYSFGGEYPRGSSFLLTLSDRVLLPFRKYFTGVLKKHYSRAFPYAHYHQYTAWFRLLSEFEKLSYIREGMRKIVMQHLSQWHFFNLRKVIVPGQDYNYRNSLFTHPLKYPPVFLPGLPAAEFPAIEDISADLLQFQANHAVIQAEILDVVNSSLPSLSYTGEDGNSYTDWRVNYLYFNGEPNPAVLSKMPFTHRLLESLDCIEKTMVMISILKPHVHIKPHVGVTNTILRGLYPVQVPADRENCYIRVGEKEHTWEEGKLLILDDTYEHEVFNNTEETRIALFFNIWHPLLCARGRELHLQMIRQLMSSRTYGIWKEFQLE